MFGFQRRLVRMREREMLCPVLGPWRRRRSWQPRSSPAFLRPVLAPTDRGPMWASSGTATKSVVGTWPSPAPGDERIGVDGYSPRVTCARVVGQPVKTPIARRRPNVGGMRCRVGDEQRDSSGRPPRHAGQRHEPGRRPGGDREGRTCSTPTCCAPAGGADRAFALARPAVDAVNVFLVADADTGTTALLTVTGGTDAVAALPPGPTRPPSPGPFAQRLAARGTAHPQRQYLRASPTAWSTASCRTGPPPSSGPWRPPRARRGPRSRNPPRGPSSRSPTSSRLRAARSGRVSRLRAARASRRRARRSTSAEHPVLAREHVPDAARAPCWSCSTRCTARGHRGGLSPRRPRRGCRPVAHHAHGGRGAGYRGCSSSGRPQEDSDGRCRRGCPRSATPSPSGRRRRVARPMPDTLTTWIAAVRTRSRRSAHASRSSCGSSTPCTGSPSTPATRSPATPTRRAPGPGRVHRRPWALRRGGRCGRARGPVRRAQTATHVARAVADTGAADVALSPGVAPAEALGERPGPGRRGARDADDEPARRRRYAAFALAGIGVGVRVRDGRRRARRRPGCWGGCGSSRSTTRRRCWRRSTTCSPEVLVLPWN